MYLLNEVLTLRLACLCQLNQEEYDVGFSEEETNAKMLWWKDSIAYFLNGV
jgi:hypothetical protein